MNTNDREQQPAGDGGRHVDVLRHLRELQPPNPEEAAALDAAIAALSGGGRSGGAVAWAVESDGLPPAVFTGALAEEAARDYAKHGNRGPARPLVFAAAPQQPTEVREAWAEERAHPGLADLLPQQPPPVGVTDEMRLDWLEQVRDRFYNIDHIAAIVGKGFLTQVGDAPMPSHFPNLREAIDAAAAFSHQQAAPSVSEKPRVHIGTIGHVDHGKTVLRAALTKVAMGEVSTPTAPEPAASGRTRMDDMIEHGMSGIDWRPSAASGAVASLLVRLDACAECEQAPLAPLLRDAAAMIRRLSGQADDPFPWLRDLVDEWEKRGSIEPSDVFARELQTRLDAITGDDIRALVYARQQDNIRIAQQDAGQADVGRLVEADPFADVNCDAAWVDGEIGRLRAANIAYASENANLQGRAMAAEAKLDALMLEYCPDEMTAEERERWAKHQRPVYREGVPDFDIPVAPPK